MNPSSNELNGLKLPPPVTEQAPKTDATPEFDSISPEPAPFGAENNASGVAAAMPTIALPPLGQAPQSQSSPKAAASSTAVPDVADDADLIEKEWVNKAKKIIEETRDDPYVQSKEITLFKADYMKKRYNKSIKLSE